MGTNVIVCSRCRNVVERGTRYCPRCGEPIDPELVTRLQTLYAQLRVFDEVIEAGDGERSVGDLRAAYVREYLDLRRGPAVAVPITVPLNTASTTPPPTTEPATPTVPVAAAAAQPVQRSQPTPTAAPAYEGSVFSWQHFVAEQAIAIMAYLGGFLLLVATLAFVVGAWQVLPDLVKLVAVVVVYIIFGALGFAFRTTQRLRAVGRIYLGVFALMTPLVALALYRFEIQHIASFPLSAMVCLSAAYAAVVYLALAGTTRFATYAYLGWTSLGVASLALVPWLNAPSEWVFFVLGLVGLALLAPTHLRHAGRVAAFVEVVAEPALQLSVLASVVASCGVALASLAIWSYGAEHAEFVPTPAAAMAGACALVPLALGWSRTLRIADGLLLRLDPLVLDAVDWLVAAFAVQAVASIATWATVSREEMGVILSVVALAELGGAYFVRSVLRERRILRRAVLSLAFAIGWVAISTVRDGVIPNWPLIVALSATFAVVVGATLIEDLPWLLLLAGLFLTWDFNTLLAATLTSHPSSEWLAFPTFELFLTLAVWCAGLFMGRWHASRRFVPWVDLVALGDALFVARLLPGHSAPYQTAILSTLAVIAFAASRIERRRIIGGLTVGFFGILAVQPFALEPPDVRSSWALAGVVLLPGIIALLVRRVFGRDWSAGPYAIALAGATVGGFSITFEPPLDTHGLSLLGMSFASWVLLGATLLALIIALWEKQPLLMIVPAALAWWAILLTPDPVASFVLVLALAGTGAGLRALRGLWWNVALLVAAGLASPIAVAALAHVHTDTRDWQVAEWLVFAVVAYLLSVQEREPIVSSIPILYALPALLILPGPNNLAPTLIITFGAAGLGIAASRVLGRQWALALYGIGIEGSLFAVGRISPPTPGSIEALLLIFAVVAYIIAALERQPWAGLVATLYAIGAILVQPDAHALLPLALAFAVVGLISGRVLGSRWSLPAYTAAVIATTFTAITGLPHPTFEAGALATLAVVAYIVVILEGRAEALPLPLNLGVLALAATARAFGWEVWQAIVSFVALSWLYFSGTWLWPILPSPRFSRHPESSTGNAVWRSTAVTIHQWGGLIVNAGAVIVALFVPSSLTPHTAEAETLVLTLVSLAGMLIVRSRTAQRRIDAYIAGELVALALSIQARWLGADNLQAFILAPASYQMVIGSLLPHDERMGRPIRAGQTLIVIGSLFLLLPTLGQSFADDPNWIYALLLSIEALVIVGVGVGMRSRLLVLIGSAFIGVAALRGGLLAINSGVPIALLIAALALILLAGAAWLSLRARRDAVL